MGTEQPISPRPVAPREPHSTKNSVTTGILLLLMAASIGWLVFMSDEEQPRPAPQEIARLNKRLREIDESEQYALIASVNGWYACLHKGRPAVHLLAGEVWKYGVTSKGEFGRYTASFLLKNKVSYIVQFRGNFADCLKQEQIKLFAYPWLPENLARLPADRLPRPPYNSIMR